MKLYPVKDITEMRFEDGTSNLIYQLDRVKGGLYMLRNVGFKEEPAPEIPFTEPLTVEEVAEIAAVEEAPAKKTRRKKAE